MARQQMIIGLSGTFASGKDVLAHYLAEKHGFLHVSTGDLLREETMHIYNSTDRPYLLKHANYLRKTHGPGILVERALERFDEQKDDFPGGLVASGIRSIGELEAIQNAGGKLVFIDAPIDIRYERAFARQRDVEKDMSFEDFKASEEKEMHKPVHNKTDQNIGELKKRADILLSNEAELDDLYAEAEAVLEL